MVNLVAFIPIMMQGNLPELCVHSKLFPHSFYTFNTTFAETLCSS